MKLFKFLFPFLFVRDWHSGRQEISRPRMFVFSAALGFIVLALLAITVLQKPVEYIVTS